MFNCICLKAPDLKIYLWSLHLVYFLFSGPFHLLFLIYLHLLTFLWASQVALVAKNLPANAGNRGVMGSIPGSERSPGEGNGTPLQYSWLENPTDRGAWQAAVRRVAKSRTRLQRLGTVISPSFAFSCSSFAWRITSVVLPVPCSLFCFCVFWNPHCRKKVTCFLRHFCLCHRSYSSDIATFICLYPGCFFRLTHVMSLRVSLFWPVIWPLKKIWKVSLPGAGTMARNSHGKHPREAFPFRGCQKPLRSRIIRSVRKTAWWVEKKWQAHFSPALFKPFIF